MYRVQIKNRRARQKLPPYIPMTKLIVIMIMTAGLAGCGHNISGLKKWVAKQISQPSGHVPPIPNVHPYKTFVYPGHNRNPFDSKTLVKLYDATHNKTNIKIDSHRPRQYLEQFPLDSLKMVGTLESHGITRALIQTPHGTIMRVKVGNYMGQHDGKIIAITANRVKLREIVPNGFGGYKKKTASIAMSQTK